MAGNNSIQFLRGNGHDHVEKLLPGQPYYDMQNNELYVGGENGTAINAAKPIGNVVLSYPTDLKKIQVQITKGTTAVYNVDIAELVTIRDGMVNSGSAVWTTGGPWAMECGGKVYPECFKNDWLDDINNVSLKGSAFPVLGAHSAGENSYAFHIVYLNTESNVIEETQMLSQTVHRYDVKETVF